MHITHLHCFFYDFMLSNFGSNDNSLKKYQRLILSSIFHKDNHRRLNIVTKFLLGIYGNRKSRAEARQYSDLW